MRRMTLGLACALAAAAFTAAPAGAEEPPKYCDPGPCLEDVVAQRIAQLRELGTDDVMFILRCVGDSLSGAACHQ